jgi:hypothetical protein
MIVAGVMVVACLYIVFESLVGYVLGQLFFSDFSWTATLCAASSLGAVGGSALCAGWRHCRILIAALCVFSIVCVGIEAAYYYRYLDIPGNDFSWGSRVLFVLCLLALAAASLFGHGRHTPDNSSDDTQAG